MEEGSVYAPSVAPTSELDAKSVRPVTTHSSDKRQKIFGFNRELYN